MIKQVMKYFFIVGCIICHFQFFSQDLDTSRQLQTFEKTISKFIINDDFLKSDKNLDLVSERSSESISTILEEETTNYFKYSGLEIYLVFQLEEEMLLKHH